MTDIVNPSQNRSASSFLTAGTIAYNSGITDGFVVSEADSPTPLAGDIDLTVGNLSGFTESSTSSSLDVTISGGEGFVFGSYLARDTTTTITLAANTSDQVVYLGWNKSEPNTVDIGLDTAFNTADPKIPLYSYDTDGSGVTATTEQYTVGRPGAPGNGGLDTNDAGDLVIKSADGTVAITVTDEAVTIDDLVTESSFTAPTYSDLGNASTDTGDIVVADGNGPDTAGIYAYTGSGYQPAGGIVDSDDDTVGELVSALTGIQLADGQVLEFGSDSDFDLRYDSNSDTVIWRDPNAPAGLLELDKDGNVDISGTLTEDTSI